MMEEFPKNKFGYLCLYEPKSERSIYIKANKIISISPNEGDLEDEDEKSVIATYYDHVVYVLETVDEIFEQLENIHPLLR